MQRISWNASLRSEPADRKRWLTRINKHHTIFLSAPSSIKRRDKMQKWIPLNAEKSGEPLEIQLIHEVDD